MKNLIRFIKEAYAELQKVTWPSKNKAKTLTVYVIGVSLGVALYVWAIDLGFNKLLSLVLK